MTNLLEALQRRVGGWLSRYLFQHTQTSNSAAPTDPAALIACLRPGDVLLVEGQTRISVAIKYLTQSTWSHAAIYVGDTPRSGATEAAVPTFVEAHLRDGVRRVGVDEYAGLHCRICRPVGLTAHETEALIAFVASRIGYRYDLKNVFDLARYLLPTPVVPSRWRRRMIALGSGDPTRAICSTLIAQPAAPGHDRGDPARAQPSAVRAARLRRLTLLRDRQADTRGRLRLPAPRMG